MPTFPYTLLHFGALVALGLGGVLGGRTTSENYHHQQKQQLQILSSSDDSDFTDVHSDPSPARNEWVDEDSLVHSHPLPSPVAVAKYPTGKRPHSPRYPYPVAPSVSHYYTDVEVNPQDLVRYPYTGAHKVYTRVINTLPQKVIRPQTHLAWSSELQPESGHRPYQLYSLGIGGVGGHSWGKGPDEFKTDSGSTSEGGLRSGNRNRGQQQQQQLQPQRPQPQRPQGNTEVNYAAVSLLALLALMGTIQHVMIDLDASLITSTNQSNMDIETANSINGQNRPRPIRPTLRPFPTGGTSQRPVIRPTQSASSAKPTTSRKPTRHKIQN